MNQLYPIFLKAHQLPILIIGAGNVGAEKLHFLLKSSPEASVEIVASKFSEPVLTMAKKHGLKVHRDEYKDGYLAGKSLVIVATGDGQLNERIYRECRDRKLLVNVADNPNMCDFYLGGIVTKGDLKLAISTNGKSPTMAKRLRQFFEQELPNNLNQLLENLNVFRKTLKGDFTSKVDALNEITKELIRHD